MSVQPLRLFVTGIGTDVGKTVASAILCEALQGDYWKPVQAGDPRDTDTVHSLVSNEATVCHPETYRFKAAKSPHAAASDEGVVIDSEKLVVPSTTRPLIIEGAGGVFVPLTETFFVLDLIEQTEAFSIVVAKNYLGSINHTLLTLEALKRRKLSVLGIVFNGPENRQSEEIIKAHSELPMIARLQDEPKLTKEVISSYAQKVGHALSFCASKEAHMSSVSLVERDAAVTWHPYTQMGLEPFSVPIVRGEGSLLFDTNGKGYIDAISSWWVTLHGHGHPEIAARIADQAGKLEQVIFSGFTHEPAVELAEQLLQVLPSTISRIFFSDNGSTAVEVALKLAIQYWKKNGRERSEILALEGGYHGDTFGAMSASGASCFTDPFKQYLFPVVRIPPPIKGREEESLNAINKALSSGKVAAFIYEPLVQGAGGMLMHDESGLSAVLSAAKRAGALLIADEVMTGFGRTGSTFASDVLTEKPDLICLSKGLTGGFMPLGVTGASKEIFNAFLSNDRKDMFFHGHSFTANPIACAAASTSLDILLRDETQTKISKITELQAKFIKRIGDHPLFGNARCRGTISAFEVKQVGKRGYLSAVRDKLVPYFLGEGILIRPLGDTIYVLPPYSTTESQLNEVYLSVEGAVENLELSL